MSQYQDDNELEDWGPSKTQLKRDAEVLQKLGAEIVSLSHSELEKMMSPSVAICSSSAA